MNNRVRKTGTIPSAAGNKGIDSLAATAMAIDGCFIHKYDYHDNQGYTHAKE
jgi:hypothetical protein